jgi:hypothetical protein
MPSNLTTAYPMGGRWNDSQSPPLSARVGATQPAFASFSGGIYGIQFGVGDEVHGSIQLSHNYARQTNLRPHWHFAFAAAPTSGETVVWGLEYVIASVNSTYAAAATLLASTYTITSSDAATYPIHRLIGSTSEISGSGLTESAVMLFRCYRSTGTSSVKPFLTSFDLHYQQGEFGTFDEYPT